MKHCLNRIENPSLQNFEESTSFANWKSLLLWNDVFYSAEDRRRIWVNISYESVIGGRDLRRGTNDYKITEKSFSNNPGGLHEMKPYTLVHWEGHESEYFLDGIPQVRELERLAHVYHRHIPQDFDDEGASDQETWIHMEKDHVIVTIFDRTSNDGLIEIHFKKEMGIWKAGFFLVFEDARPLSDIMTGFGLEEYLREQVFALLNPGAKIIDTNFNAETGESIISYDATTVKSVEFMM